MQGTNLKPGQQLQDLIMGLVALVMMKDAGAGGQTAAATGSDSGEEKAAAEAGNGLIAGVKDGDDAGLSHRSKVSSNNGASNSASETDNRHLLDTLALLLFTGLEAIQQEPGKESGASGETQSLLPKDGRTETEIAAAPAPAQRPAGGPAAESADDMGRETVASPGDELNGFAARFLDAGTDAAASTGTTAVRAELTLAPAGEAGLGRKQSHPAGIHYWGPAPPTAASAATGRTGGGNPARLRRTGSPLTSANACRDLRPHHQRMRRYGGRACARCRGRDRGGSGASPDGVVTIVKELTPLLFESRDGNASHDPAAGKESPGAKEGYPTHTR